MVDKLKHRLCQRPYSIRTRIKTLSTLSGLSTTFVRDHIPLEQGLRLALLHSAATAAEVRDHIPLEQGLRPIRQITVYRSILCQRPYSIRTRIKTEDQGVPGTFRKSQRPYSIRTRIKTSLPRAQASGGGSETIFH